MKLDVFELTVRYGAVTALDNVSLAVEAGRLTAVMGRNGAGKSTLLKAICGLVPTARGRISVDGATVRTPGSRIAYLPQKDRVDQRFPITVRGVVEMGRFPFVGWLGRFRERDHHRVDEALRLLDLESIADRHISELSGGQQQRAYIARALALEADLLLFDEPYAGLDQPTQDGLTEVLRMLADRGKLLLVSHHDAGTVERYFSDVVLVNRTLIAQGAVSDTLNDANVEEAFYRG